VSTVGPPSSPAGGGWIRLLRRVIEALDEAGIPHMVSGSVASTRHGEARATQDIDIVIDPSEAQIDVLLDRLARRRPGDSELFVDDALEAWRHRSQFNVLDPATGCQVDLIIRKDRPYSRREFERRQPARIGAVDLFVVSPEDSILSKLEWSRTSESERQRRDAQSIVEVQGDGLDWAYLDRWAVELEVADLLASVRDQARP